MFKRIFEKQSLIKHLRILMTMLSIQVHDLDCLTHKYKHIAQYMVNGSGEYKYMLQFIRDIDSRMIEIMNTFNQMQNIYVNINLQSQTSNYLRTMVNEILDVDRLLKKEAEDIDEHYTLHVKPHYDYIRESDLYMV